MLGPRSTTEPGLSKSCRTRSSISTSRLFRIFHSRLFNCHRLKFQSCRIRLSLPRRGRRRIRLQIQVLVFVLVVLIVTYLLKEVGDQMGLTDYVVGGIKEFPVQLLPLMIFLAIGAIAIATGSSWGVYAVVTPIVFALSKETGMNPMLGMGALISAGVMGANICFYSDSRILTASSTESNMTAQAISQLPYVIITTIITAILFLLLGYTM